MQFEIANTFTDKSSKDYNPSEAVKWYELAAEAGKAWAMLKLAFLYSSGDLGKYDPEKAFVWFDKAGGGDTPKHYLGTANLAICYLNGIGTNKDTEKAAALFRKFKDSDFICYLGTLGQCPTTIVTWEQRLKLIETWAKNKKDPQAQYFFALRYKNGWDVPVDLDDAVHWLKKAAKSGHGASWTELGVLHEYNARLFNETYAEGLASAVDCYKKASDVGEIDGMANYAAMLDDGKGVARDSMQAERLYLRCLEIEPNHARSHNNLASVYENRLSTKEGTLPGTIHDKLLKDMLDHYNAATRLELPYAARNLGRIYREGKLVDRDLRKAYGYYEQAAERGLPGTHYTLGQMLENGEGVPVTYSEAAYHYRLAALDGDTTALRHLIDLYLSGKTGTTDYDRASFWLGRLASTTGDGVAFMAIADVMFARKEYTAVIDLLKQMAAMERNPSLVGFACERLSRCYAAGLGVKVNPARAKRYFDRAVARNNCDALARLGIEQIDQGKPQEAIATLKRATDKSAAACYYLGQLYFFGTHVEKDQVQAFQLLRKAAEKNHFEALYFLAGTTFNRVPGAPSIEEAIRMAGQAEAGGLEKAKALREKLERRLNKTNPSASEESAGARSS